MVIGFSSHWHKRLKDTDAELTACIKRLWLTVIERLNQTEKEDDITERLVDVLREDRAVCQLGFLHLHFKLRKKDTHGDYTTKGILDMALFLDQDHERYIAYECKHLNRVNSQGKRTASLAGAYVEEGVVRYATAKYAEQLPYGCMIGYVMDGDMKFALKQLESAINKRKCLIKLSSAEVDITSVGLTEFETTHLRPNDSSSIHVRHKLFSMI